MKTSPLEKELWGSRGDAKGPSGAGAAHARSRRPIERLSSQLPVRVFMVWKIASASNPASPPPPERGGC